MKKNLEETKTALKKLILKLSVIISLLFLKNNIKLILMNSIVIGSGFGGIAAALRLKAKNHKVTLIEKHKRSRWKS